MNVLLLIMALLALGTTQALEGGWQIALCLPGFALLALAAVLSWWPLRRRAIPRQAGECLGAALIFAGYISIRAVFSPEEYLARTDLYVALAGLALYLLVALNLTASRWRSLFMGGMLALGVANCAIGAVQFFKGHNFMPFPFLPRPDCGPRISGFYGYPNHLAAFLEMTLMFSLSVACWSRWPTWAKVLVGYLCAVFLIAIGLTGSRSGYISTIVGLMVFVLLSLVLVGKLGASRAIVLFFVGVLMIGGAAFGVRKVLSKNSLLQSRADSTLTVDVTRMRLWQAAWKQFRVQPVVGTGSGTHLYYARLFRSYGVPTDPVHAHNDYFELIGEYGFLGIIAAVIFLETHLRHGWTSFKRRVARGTNDQGLRSNSLALNIGALSAAATAITHPLMDFTFHMPANVLTAAFVFGVLANPGEGPEPADAREAPAGWPAWLRLALPALGILMIVRIAPTAPAEYYTERVSDLLADWHRAVSPDLNEKMEALALRGLSSDPHNPELLLALGEAQTTLGDLATDPKNKETFYSQAVDSDRNALKFAPGDVSHIIALGSALDDAHRSAEADPLFDQALTLDPRGPGTHNIAGYHLLLEGKLAEAQDQFRLAIQFGAGMAADAGLAQVRQALKAKDADAPLAPDTSKGK